MNNSSPSNSAAGEKMSVEVSDKSSDSDYVVRCLSDLTAGGTLLKAGRSVSPGATLRHRYMLETASSGMIKL